MGGPLVGPHGVLFETPHFPRGYRVRPTSNLLAAVGWIRNHVTVRAVESASATDSAHPSAFPVLVPRQHVLALEWHWFLKLTKTNSENPGFHWFVRKF